MSQRDRRQRPADTAAQNVLRPSVARFAWARQWEFWLALLLGAFLRFWRLDLTQYLDDQTRLMQLARLSVTHGLIPLTGIPSSIHTLNPPLSVYLLLPFAAFTANPMPVVISIALWNVIGVALCYVFALRYFGRRVAAVSALLFATCGAAINYSRFIWQQNYLPPLLILWLLTLYLGCVEGRRRWFAGNVALLALAALLHPTAALLAPVTLVGAALAPRIPRWGAWGAAGVAVLLLAIPTLVWEALSGFSDVRAARTFALGHSRLDAAVLYYLYQAIGGGPASTHGAAGPLFVALNVIATALFAAGWLVLSAWLLRPAQALTFPRADGFARATRAWLVALFRGLKADARWRSNLLLWLSVTVPCALMLRHSGALFTHYLMVLYPTAFIVSGIGVSVGIEWLGGALARRTTRLGAVALLALEAALLALILARSAQWLTYPASLTDSQTFNAYHDYGYPLSVLQSGDGALSHMRSELNAAHVEVITPSDPRYQLPEDYILAGERPSRFSVTPECLAAPATTGATWLVAPITPDSPAARVVAQIGGARQVGALPMVGGPSYPVYELSGQTPLLNNETPLAPTTFDDQHGDRLTLISASIPLSGAVLLRWTVDASYAPAAATREVRFIVSTNGATAYTDCATQAIPTGAYLFTWIPLNVGSASDISVSVQTSLSGLDMPQAFGVRFLADAVLSQPFARTQATIGAHDHFVSAVTLNPDGSIVIPAHTLQPGP